MANDVELEMLREAINAADQDGQIHELITAYDATGKLAQILALLGKLNELKYHLDAQSKLLDEVSKLASGVDWRKFKTQLRAAAFIAKYTASKQTRELPLLAAERAGLAVKRGGKFDYVGPVRILHQGRRIKLMWGKLLFEEISDDDPLNAANRVVKTVKEILERPFSSSLFFELLRTAYRDARFSGYKSIPTMYRAFSECRSAFLSRPVKADRFSTTDDDYNTQIITGHPYSMVSFLMDLARFDEEGRRGDEFLSMKQAVLPNEHKRAFLLPYCRCRKGDYYFGDTPILGLKIECDDFS